MEVLKRYGLVYLPMGLQPFQENVLQQPTLNAMEWMKSHIGDVVRGLEKDIIMINALRQSLNDLAATSENIETYTTQLWSDCQRALVASKPRWWELFSNTRQYRLEIHTIEQQALWLGKVRDGIGLISEKLCMMADDFQSTIHSCRKFQEQLSREGEMARFGWNVSYWIDRQADDLEGGFEDLRFDLQKFIKKKIRFDREMFRL